MTTEPNKLSETPAFWTYKVDSFPSPVAQFRMAQLIDLDDRLYETARIVYRFLVGWYHDVHGDALLSQRHVAKVMKQRAPAGAAVPSRNAVQRAIIALMETGWVVRSFQGRGKGRGASRYVPVMNVLELAAQGKFPQPAHTIGPVDDCNQLARPNGPPLAHAIGPVDGATGPHGGPKTLLLDSGTDPRTSKVSVSAQPASLSGAGAAGFEAAWIRYGKRGNKAASRAVWAALSPDHILASCIAERAAAWAASARPGSNRMPFQKWLEQEKWDEADRRPREVSQRAATKAATHLAPANDNHLPAENTMPARPIDRTAGKITATELFNKDRETIVRITMGGKTFDIRYESFDYHRQEAGQLEMGQLAGIAGRNIEESADLVGMEVVAETMSDGSRRWRGLEKGQ